jgi:hypothetical protein
MTSSLYGVKPEPLSIDDQVTTALLLIGQHLLRHEHYRYTGPELSPQQLAVALPGYQPTSPVRLNVWWEPDEQLLETELRADGSGIRQGLTGVAFPISLEALVDLGMGHGLLPEHLICRNVDQILADSWADSWVAKL